MARVSTKTPGAAIEVALKKIGASTGELAEASGVSESVIKGIIEKNNITPEQSVKIGKALGKKGIELSLLQLTEEILAAEKSAGRVKKLAMPKKAKKSAGGKPGPKQGAKKKAAATGKKPGRKPSSAAHAVAGAPKKKPGRKPASGSASTGMTLSGVPKKKPGRKPKTV